MKIRYGIAIAMLTLGVGCPAEEDNNTLGTNNGAGTNNGTGTNNGETTGTSDMGTGTTDTGNNNGGTDTGNGSDMGGGGEDMGTTSAWQTSQHTCVGNRTDALFCDDDQTCYVGCGTTTNGQGLYATGDGGATWTTLATNPAAFFETGRVNSIWRGTDGPLYAAGEFANSAAVVSIADSGALTQVFTRGNQVSNSFSVGKFRRASNGYAIAESLNGVELVVREADGNDTDSWTSGRGFWSDGDADDDTFGVQILDMEVYNDQFWAVGSTISQPPYVFTPKWAAGDFDFGLVQLATGLGAFDGEMWGIDVNADGVTVGGVNQDRDTGIVYSFTTGGDETDAANWVAFDVATIFPSANNKTWVTDVCRTSNNVVYAVGRETIQGWGFVLKSDDGGTTFADITPYDVDGNSEFPDVSRCQAFAEGVIVAGAEGLFARNF